MTENQDPVRSLLAVLLPDEPDAEQLFERITLAPGEIRETVGEIHILLSGRVQVIYETPLRNKASYIPAIGGCFGGVGLLDEETLQHAPELQMLWESFEALEASEVLALPQHLARRERGLASLVSLSLGMTILELNRGLLREGLLEEPSLARASRASLEALLTAGRVVALALGETCVAVPEAGAVLALWGSVVVAGGEVLPRFELAPAGSELTSLERGLVLVIDDISQIAERSSSAAAQRERSRDAWARLERSARWRQAPSGLDPRALFVERRFTNGQVLTNSSGRGLPASEPGLNGALFYILDGEVKVSTELGASAVTRKRRSWVGGDGWMERYHQRLMSVGISGVCAVARGDVRALVAIPDPALPDWERSGLRRLSIAHLICEANRTELRQALQKISGLKGCSTAAINALVERGEIVLLKRGARIQAPAGELFIPLQAHLSVIPLSGDHRFIPAPPAFTPLGAAEFFTNIRPEVAWEARRVCWLFRLTRATYQGCRRSHTVRLPPLVTQEAGFDRAGGAELVLVDGDRSLGGALPVMVDLIAQAMVSQFDDLVLVARLGGPEASQHAAVQEGGAGQPDRIRWCADGPLTIESLSPTLKRWNDDYAFIFLIPCDASDALDAEGLESIAPLAERLIYVSEDPTACSTLSVSMDCATHFAALLPRAPWRQHVLDNTLDWAPDGQHPGFPDGAVRLRLSPEDYRATRALEELPEVDQRRFERWARSLTDRLVGVALGGGGAYGFVHVALLMELERSGIPVDMISGASVGATVGSVYSAAGAIGLQEFVRLSDHLRRVMSLNMLTMRFMSGYIDSLLAHLADIAPHRTHPSEQPLEGDHWPVLPPPADRPRGRRQRLRDALAWSPVALMNVTRDIGVQDWKHYRSLQDFEVPFFPVATDLETGQEVALEVGLVAEGVRASGSFPLASPPSPHPSDPTRLLIDGGFAANIPDAVLARQGVGMLVASNPIPPPSASNAALGGASGWPLIKRGFQAYRASHILMHSVGLRNRRASGATYNAPPSKFGIMDLDKSADIARLPYQQEEFHETLQEIHQAWDRLRAPRRPAGLVRRRRDASWTDLARTGWAVIFPEGITRSSPVFKAIAPLIAHRREQIRASGSTARLQIFLGRGGHPSGQSASEFLESVGVSSAPHPDRLGYHILLVGSPEDISFEFQLTLDIDYAVGRLWFDDPAEIAAYVQRLLASERAEERSPRTIDLACLARSGKPAEILGEKLLPALHSGLTARLPDWSIRQPASGDSAEQTARAVFANGGSDLLMVAGQTWLGWEGLQPSQHQQIGWPLIDSELTPLAALTDGSPKVVFLFGGATGGIGVQSRYDFMEQPPPLTYPPKPQLAGFAQALLLREDGPLVVVGKLDVSWLVAPFEGRQSETFALSEALEMVAGGRTVGASMQSSSDLYHRKQHLSRKVSRLGTELDPRQAEGLKLSIENARCWLVLGDPAVRLVAAAR